MKKILFTIVTVAALVACNKEASLPISGEGSRATFVLNADTFSDKESKALSPEEHTLANIAVLQFSAEGAFAKYVFVPSVNGSDNSLTLLLEPGAGQTVAFVANVTDAEPFSTFSGNLTAFRNLAKTIAAESDLTTTDNKLIMYGEYRGEISEEGKTHAAISMKRIVAKVEFMYAVDMENPGESFTLKSVQMKNVPNSMFYAAQTTAKYPETTATYIDYALISVTQNHGSELWYLSENARGTGTGSTSSQKDAANASTQADGNKATYIELVGDYTFESGSTLALSYKIYLGADPVKDYNVLRNHFYKVSITIRGANAADLRISVESGGGEIVLGTEDTGDGGGGTATIG